VASSPAHPRDPLVLLDPLLGEWVADGESPVGPYRCRRRFTRVLGDSFVQLDIHWEYASAFFDELTIFGADEVHGLQYRTFDSNGEQSVGHLSAAGGLSEDAMVFESLTPTGRLRMSYWPTGIAGIVVFNVESKSGDRWKRLVEHRYRPVRM
jgi:hypothetical protein